MVPHPGVMLLRMMNERRLSRHGVARGMSVPVMRVSELCSGQRSITANSAIRLGCYFGTTAEYWMGLQSVYDLDRVRKDFVSEIVPYQYEKIH